MGSDEVGQLWAIACEHAEYEPGSQAVLYLITGNSKDGHSALHIEPGSRVFSDPEWPLDARQIADANSPARRHAHRILVRDFRSPRVALGRLRHELEHARQYDKSPDIYLAMDFVQDAVSRAFDEREPPSRTGSAAIYNILPSEEDANRAAAQLTTSHFGPPSDEELADTNGPLFRDESPIQEATLAGRLLATAALFPAAFVWVAQDRKVRVEDLLARFGPDGPAAWDMLQGHPEIAQHGKAALDRCPSKSSIKAAVRPPAAWLSVLEEIQEGRRAAKNVLDGAGPELKLH